jgi:cardiolipin synthase (CMP-forming)
MATLPLTIPNLLTFLRLGLIPIFAVAALTDRYTLALVLFVFAGVTDILDGYLARLLNQRSRVGAILDPAADKILMVTGYVLFTVHDTAPFTLPGWLTFTVFIRDLLIVIFAYLLYTRVHISRFPPSIAGKISTLLQIVTLSFLIAANTPISWFALPVVRPLFWATIVLTLYSGFDYMRRADRRLHEMGWTDD